MHDDLNLPPGLAGRVVHHRAGDIQVRAHHHAEVELNLVVRGTATYLLGERRYLLIPATMTWLFPAQEHVLVNESADHELWWAVFSPAMVTQAARTAQARPLLYSDPPGEFSRRLATNPAHRLHTLFAEVKAAETRDAALANAGLAYLLLLAWRAFLDSHDAVTATDVHPAIGKAALMLRADPSAGDLTELAGAVGLSPGHLSRLFKAQTGTSLSRYRNQQRLHRFLLAYGSGQPTTALAAALAAGFGSYAQFYRVFRQETGRAPAALPDQAKNNSPGPAPSSIGVRSCRAR